MVCPHCEIETTNDAEHMCMALGKMVYVFKISELPDVPGAPDVIPYTPRKSFMQLVQEAVPSAFLGARPVAMREVVDTDFIEVWVEGAPEPVLINDEEIGSDRFVYPSRVPGVKCASVTIDGIPMRVIHDPPPEPDYRTALDRGPSMLDIARRQNRVLAAWGGGSKPKT
jgi:hypothetical protein